MAEASIGGFDLGFQIPTISTAGIGYWITFAVIVLMVCFCVGLGFWIWYQNKLFSKKIILFENIAGAGWRMTSKDRARIVKIGSGGEELLYLKKRKVYRTAYGKKMDKNTYWFAIGQDGYWYNIILGDLDAKMGMLDIEPIDRDMRYMHVAIRKNIQERYRKVGLMEKYGVVIIQGFFFIIMIIAIWLLLSKVGDQIHAATQITEAVKPLANEITNAIAHIDNLCGGSGIKPAS